MIKNNFKPAVIAFFIILSNMLSYYIFKEVKTDLISLTPEMSKTAIKLLKFFIAPLLQVGVAGVYLLLSRKFTVYRLVQGTLTFSLAIFSLFFLLLIPNIEALQAFGYQTTSPINDVLYYWITSSFYLINSLWPVITILLFYGFTNERYSFTEASTLYPLFAIIVLILSNLVIPSILPPTLQIFNIHNTMALWIAAFSLIAIVKMGYFFFNRLENEEKEQQEGIFSWKYIISLGLLALSIGLVKNLTVLISDFNFRLRDGVLQENWKYLIDLASIGYLIMFMAIMIMIFLAFYLKQYRGKGWKNLCYGGTMITLVVGITLLFINIFGGLIESFVNSASADFTFQALMSVGKSYQVLVSATLLPALICLKELAFTPMRQDQKFRSKVIIDLVFWKLGYFLSVALQESFWGVRAFTTPVMMYIALVFFVTIGARLALIRYVGKELELAA